MHLFEYEAKHELSVNGIVIPKGTLVSNSNEALAAIEQLKPPYMVKAQVLVSGRAKAGGIITAKTGKEAQEAAAKLLGTQLKGMTVRQVLIEEKLAKRKELYIGIMVDRSNRSYVALASANGGVEIEEIADKTPEAIVKAPIDWQFGFSSFQAAALAKHIGYNGDQLLELSAIMLKLYQICVNNDAELVEINPLAETENGSFEALDARMSIDDNALFRHPEYAARHAQGLTPQEDLASKNNLAYVKLEGNIGVVGNGAGLVMATLDLVNLFGGSPADFLDLGGGANIEAITVALQIVFSDPNTSVILVNVLGGITHCDDIARGIVKVMSEVQVKKPLVVRLMGSNQREGQEILAKAGIITLNSMEEAAKQAVELARGVKF